MNYNDNNAADQRHLLYLGKKPDLASDEKQYKIIKKFSDDEKEIISNELKKLIATGEVEPTQTALAKAVHIHITEVNKLLSTNPLVRKRVSGPAIIKLINTVKMTIPNRPDLSFPLVYKRRNMSMKSIKTKIEPEPDKHELSKETLVVSKDIPDLPDPKPALHIRIQEIIDQYKNDLKQEEQNMIHAAISFTETPLDAHRQCYFLKQEIIRRIKNDITLLEKVIKS